MLDEHKYFIAALFWFSGIKIITAKIGKKEGHRQTFLAQRGSFHQK